jgi:hypothetical protein
MEVYRNSRTHNYDITISKDEWERILCLPEIQKDKNILPALRKWYMESNYTSSCKLLGEKYDRDFQYFSAQNRRLGEFAANHLKKFRLIGEDDREVFWGVALLQVRKEKREYIMRLRPDLVDAIRSLGLFAESTDGSE